MGGVWACVCLRPCGAGPGVPVPGQRQRPWLYDLRSDSSRSPGCLSYLPRYQAVRTCFFGPPDRQRIVWIMNISFGVTGDRHLGIDLAQKGTKIESSIFSILTDS